MDTVTASLQRAVRTLEPHSESPRLDAELLLGKVLGISRTALIVGGDAPLPDETQRAFEDLVARRMGGMPVSYLTGTREFWSMALAVTPDVLVPRPETELVVELALARCPPGAGRSVLDLGTGSGAIALALATERPAARVTAVDVSPAALEVARGNAARLGLTRPGLSRIEWRRGSWFDTVPGERFDLIVANPPYLASSDPELDALQNEPRLALCAGATGLEALFSVIDGAGAHLNLGGWLLLEHGSTQAEAVAERMADRGFADIRSQDDTAGRPRVTFGTAPSFQPASFASTVT